VIAGHRLDQRRLAERRGTNKARVAVARTVLALVYHGLRGEIAASPGPPRREARTRPDASS
jgi:hypothetical protein